MRAALFLPWAFCVLVACALDHRYTVLTGTGTGVTPSNNWQTVSAALPLSVRAQKRVRLLGGGWKIIGVAAPLKQRIYPLDRRPSVGTRFGTPHPDCVRYQTLQQTVIVDRECRHVTPAKPLAFADAKTRTCRGGTCRTLQVGRWSVLLRHKQIQVPFVLNKCFRGGRH